MSHTQNEKHITEIRKSDYTLSKTFYFTKISYVWGEL